MELDVFEIIVILFFYFAFKWVFRVLGIMGIAKGVQAVVGSGKKKLGGLFKDDDDGETA